MRLKTGVTARLALRDGTTVLGRTARSGQFGVHRLEKVRVFTRVEPAEVRGYLLIPDRNVWFAQIMPPPDPDLED